MTMVYYTSLCIQKVVFFENNASEFSFIVSTYDAHAENGSAKVKYWFCQKLQHTVFLMWI